MKRPSELRQPAMGLKESLIQITDQLRQSAVKSETVQSTSKVHLAKKPAPKSNQQEEIIIYETSGHDGVALPLTMEDIEREMAQVEFQLQESTPKEGISTWILLSGTETTPQPNAKGPAYAVESEPEKKLESDKKIDKIMKVKDDKESPVLLPKRRPSTQAPPLVRVKPKKSPATTTTSTTTTTTEAPATSSVKPKVKPELRVNVKRPRRPTTTTTTTVAPETTTVEEEITEEPADDHHRESSTFLIIEPKDSEFDLPADRSPIQGKKKTAVTKPAKKTKRKPDVKNKKKPGLEQMLEEIVTAVEKPGKTPNKNKEKPISTQIMNYLSREVMPTVGVGIVGLVAAAGIATYFLGTTFTPLRRNDRTDEIYYNNNEEYAGPDGQYEEEWFSKVIAGSPTYRNNLRQAYKPANPAVGPNGANGASVAQQNYAVKQYPQYSKYARPPPPQGPQGPYPVNPNHRNYNVRPNFGPQNYRINAGPSMPTGANPSELVRKHSMAMPHNYPHHQQYHHGPPPQQQAAPPPQFAEPAKEPDTQGYFSEASKRHSFSSGASEILAETPPQEPATVADGPIEDSNFLKRTSQASALSSGSQQFVVGSVYPEALTAKDSSLSQAQAESVPEHGPRRRRRAAEVAQQLRKKTKKLDDNELDNENELPIEELEQIANVQVATDNPVTTVHEHVTSSSTVSSTSTSIASAEESVEEQGKVPSTTSKVTYYETETISSGNSSFGDFFRRMFTLKLKLGISFLRGMADGVAKYLHQVEERVYRSRL